MKKISNVRVAKATANRAFYADHMIITLPITEKVMTAKMMEILHNSIDRFENPRSKYIIDSYETTLGIDVLSSGEKYFIFTVDVYFKGEEPPETTIEFLDFPPELEKYYFNEAIKQLAINLNCYGK